MNINIVDVAIIISLILFGIIGFKRGVFKELVLCLGTFFVFYLAYKLKNPIGEFLLLKTPLTLFDFPNMFQGTITLNILVYEGLAFVVVLSILLIIFNLIINLTGIFEKVLKFTIVLGIPSKILGFIAGVLEGYLIVFVVLFFLMQPAFSFPIFMDSKIGNAVLNSSPVLTNISEDTVQLIANIYELKDEKDKNVLNSKILDMMLAKKVVSYDTVKELHEKEKMNFEGMEEILARYKGE